MLQSNNKTALQSQEWILNALLHLMNERQYSNITVAQLCRVADLDRRTFYRNFDSKEDVLNHFIHQLEMKYISGFDAIKNKNSFEAILYFFEFWEQHISFIRNMKSSGLIDFVFERFQIISKDYSDLFIEDIEEKSHNSIILAYRIGGFWNAMLDWAFLDNRLSPKEMAYILTREL